MIEYMTAANLLPSYPYFILLLLSFSSEMGLICIWKITLSYQQTSNYIKFLNAEN